MTSPLHRYGVVILAAGNSSRLGRPKQLITFRGKSLLENTVDAAIKTAGKRVLVVTGAYREAIGVELSKLAVHVFHNTYWAEGIASSIYSGLITMLDLFPDTEGIIFSVCDQPFISAALFKKMIALHLQTQKGIIAAYYNNTAGVPVLFSTKYVDSLLRLEGMEGAKTLLKQFADDMAKVTFAKGNIDIDTLADIDKLNELNQALSR